MFLVQYYRHNLNNITPLENWTFNNLGIFQSLKLHNLMGKSFEFLFS